VQAKEYEAAAAALGAAPGTRTWARLEQLFPLWTRYSSVINLTGATGREELCEHVVEGLQAVKCAADAGVRGLWLDVGSGGGFPGLVALAAGWEVWLVEPRAKRAGFLELARAELGGDGGVLATALEPDTWQEKLLDGIGERAKMGIAVASARAVWAPEEWLGFGRRMVAPRGVVLIHVKNGDPDPGNSVSISRVDGGRWSVRAYTAVDA
jgi:16S rRNA (guanine527-N7)-methyltransferase